MGKLQDTQNLGWLVSNQVMHHNDDAAVLSSMQDDKLCHSDVSNESKLRQPKCVGHPLNSLVSASLLPGKDTVVADPVGIASLAPGGEVAFDTWYRFCSVGRPRGSTGLRLLYGMASDSPRWALS